MKTKTCGHGHQYIESETSTVKRSQCPKCYWAPVDEYIERHPDQFIPLGGEHQVHANGREWFKIRLENRRRRAQALAEKVWDSYAERVADRPFFKCGHPRTLENAYIYRHRYGKAQAQCRECNKRRMS